MPEKAKKGEYFYPVEQKKLDVKAKSNMHGAIIPQLFKSTPNAFPLIALYNDFMNNRGSEGDSMVIWYDSRYMYMVSSTLETVFKIAESVKTTEK